MGWFWRNDSSSSGNDQQLRDSTTDDDLCFTFEGERTLCETKEIEPGKYVTKCVKTKENHRYCLGKPFEVVISNTEYTEEDVTEKMVQERSTLQVEEKPVNQPLYYVDVHVDLNAMERQRKSIFEAVEEMKSKVSNLLHLKPK